MINTKCRIIRQHCVCIQRRYNYVRTTQLTMATDRRAWWWWEITKEHWKTAATLFRLMTNLPRDTTESSNAASLWVIWLTRIRRSKNSLQSVQTMTSATNTKNSASSCALSKKRSANATRKKTIEQLVSQWTAIFSIAFTLLLDRYMLIFV